MPTPSSMLALTALVAVGLVSSLQAGEPATISVELTVMEIAVPDEGGNRGKPVGATRTVVGEAAGLRRLFDLIAERDDAEILSAPTIVTRSGQEANLVVGGEFPVPVLQANGQWTKEFRTFGTKIDIVPKMVEDDVHIAFTAEFSERDFANAVTVNGQKVPGLRIRRFQANGTVEPGEALLQIAEHDDATRVLLVHPQQVTELPQ